MLELVLLESSTNAFSSDVNLQDLLGIHAVRCSIVCSALLKPLSHRLQSGLLEPVPGRAGPLEQAIERKDVGIQYF